MEMGLESGFVNTTLNSTLMSQRKRFILSMGQTLFVFPASKQISHLLVRVLIRPANSVCFNFGPTCLKRLILLLLERRQKSNKFGTLTFSSGNCRSELMCS